MPVYPNSNLPSASQPWGRAMQNKLETLDTQFLTERTNNTARDSQLQSAYTRLDATVEDVKDALTEVGIATSTANTANSTANGIAAGTTAISGNGIITGTLSASKITSGTLDASLVTVNNLNASKINTGTLDASLVTVTNINATNIKTGTLTGITITGNTIKTAASGQRVELSGTSEAFYNASAYTGSIYGSTDQSANSVTTVSGSGQLSVFGQGAASGGVYAGGSGASILVGSGGSGTVINSSGTTFATGGEFRSTCTSNRFTQSTTFDSGILVSGTLQAGSGISATGTISTGGGLQRTQYSGGGTTGASVDNNGTFIRTSSSARYKQDIQDADYTYDAVLELQPKSFRLKSEAAEDDNAIFYPGFVAEELAGTDLDIFVSYETLPDGTRRPDGVRYAELTSALVSAIKHQDGLIKSLTARIEALESKV